MPKARALVLAAATLATTAGLAMPASAQVELLDEVRQTVQSESGYVDLEIPGFAPGEPVMASSTELNAPRLVIQTLSAGEPNPYADSPSRVFRFIAINRFYRTLQVEAEAAGADVDVYVGVDSNGNRRPDPEEESCRASALDSVARCIPENIDQYMWVMAHHRGGDTVPVHLRWFLYFDGYLRDDKQQDSSNALVSAPGRVGDGGTVPLRLSYSGTAMADGDLRLGRVRVSTPSRTVEMPVRLQREGSGFSPTLLMGEREITLEPGQVHDQLVVLAPAGSNLIRGLMERVNAEPVALMLRPKASLPAGPLLPAAPILNGEESYRALPINARYDQVTLLGDLPMLWYVTPVNYGQQRAVVRVLAGAGIEEDSGAQLRTVRQGSYFNPARSGQGVFVYRSGNAVSLLWYTYEEDGDPTWLYAQSEADPQAATGDLGPSYLPLYRSAWLGDKQRLYEVGHIALYPLSDNSLVMAYQLDGRSGLETLQYFLTGCPGVDGSPVDASGHWFDPARAGSGYSVQVHPDYEFIASFIYDRLGRPRFLVAERGGAFDAGDRPLVLEQLQGFDPFGPHSQPVRTAVGVLNRRYAQGALEQVSVDAAFAGGVDGDWRVTDQVRPLGQTQGCAP